MLLLKRLLFKLFLELNALKLPVESVLFRVRELFIEELLCSLLKLFFNQMS
jgi:hypothetical protein